MKRKFFYYFCKKYNLFFPTEKIKIKILSRKKTWKIKSKYPKAGILSLFHLRTRGLCILLHFITRGSRIKDNINSLKFTLADSAPQNLFFDSSPQVLSLSPFLCILHCPQLLFTKSQNRKKKLFRLIFTIFSLKFIFYKLKKNLQFTLEF